MRKKLSISNILFWTGVISLILTYCILWAQMISNPAQRTGTDFIAFYTAGRIAREDGATEVYKIAYQKDIQEDVLGFPPNQPLLYNHLPFLIPLLKLIALENYTTSFLLWVLIQISLYIGSFSVLAKSFSYFESKKNLRNILTSGILFFPIFISLLVGQDTGFLFFGVAIFTFGTFRKNDFLSGLGLALTTVRPHLALFLAIPIFFKNKRAFLYFSGLSLLLALFSLGILGKEGTKDFIQILTISSEGAWNGMKEIAMFNLIGIATRSFSAIKIGAIHTLGWSAYFFAIISTSIIWSRTQGRDSFLLVLTILASLFFAPHLHYHDLSLMLIPLLLILKEMKAYFSEKNIPLIILAISFILIFTQSTPLLYFSLPYLLGISLIILAKRIETNI